MAKLRRMLSREELDAIWQSEEVMADGWIRDFSGAAVTFHTADGDVAAPIVGRVCMDQCMADVTDLPVDVSCRVTLFGQTSEELEALAKKADTITYELLCLITARIPRVYS